jgi:segregation and condensation protein A
MLLPREVDEKGEEIDPRDELVKALLQYKRYKEIAEELSFLETVQRKIKFRGNFSEDEKETPHEYETLLKNVSVYDLAKYFKNAIEQLKEEPVHQINRINVSIDEQMQFILHKLDEKKEINFLTLMSELHEKIRIIVTFIALLEMVKMGKVGIKITKDLTDFILIKVQNG